VVGSEYFHPPKNAESIFDYQPWFIQRAGQWQLVELKDWKRHSQDLIIKVKGVDDRDAANATDQLRDSGGFGTTSAVGGR
jgi:ribosomal 30S subunit maturation factor RimM